MRTKTNFTIVEQAIIAVPGFKEVVKKMYNQITLKGQSDSTLSKNQSKRLLWDATFFSRLMEVGLKKQKKQGQ